MNFHANLFNLRLNSLPAHGRWHFFLTTTTTAGCWASGERDRPGATKAGGAAIGLRWAPLAKPRGTPPDGALLGCACPGQEPPCAQCPCR